MPSTDANCLSFNNREGEAELLSALTMFVNMLLQGRCHPLIVRILFGGRLIALVKASGGIRPTVTVTGRLTSKCAGATVLSMLSDYLAPQQLGFWIT